jgi:hypothetical protein
VTVEDTQRTAIKITKLEDEICRFDSILDRIQKVMPDNMRVYGFIVLTRDAMFKLQQTMYNCEIVEFAAPWIEPADIFWEKKTDDDDE